MMTTNEPADRLAVLGIEAVGHHGVFDFERRDGQLFRVDLALGVDTRSAARPIAGGK
jgi:dihydroneopterin aldolase